MKTKQENLTVIIPGIYQNESGQRLKFVGISFLNGYPCVNWHWTNVENTSRSGGTGVESFEKFISNFKLIKENDLSKYKKLVL